MRKPILALDLPAGEHVLTLFITGHVNFSAFDIQAEGWLRGGRGF